MTPEPGPRRRTLVIQPLPGIGDMVWHLPPIHAIAKAAPDGRVSILTKPRSLADRLLVADPAVDRILWLHRNPGIHDGVAGLFRLVALLRREAFATVWILHPSARYALAALLAGIPRRIGFGIGVQKRLLNHAAHLAEEDRHSHPIDKAMRLVTACGLTLEEDEPQLTVLPAAAARIAERYGYLPEPWVAVGIGSSEPFKQWGADNFAALAARLAGPGGPTLFLLGGPDETDMGRRIAAGVRAEGGTVEDAVGRPIEETAALLARCRLYVGNDTGVLNMAAAVGVDGIGLFGGSPPLHHSRHIRCVTPPAGESGMERISVEQVMAAVRDLGLGAADAPEAG